jgi:hypothetical protein
MAFAVVHVLGALGASIAFAFLVVLITAWEQEHTRKRVLQSMSIAMGVPAASIETDESLVPQIIEYASRRFDSELLRNRLSDLSGMLRTAWGWLGGLIQVGIIAAVAWSMFVEGAESARYMWSVPAVAVFFWLTSVGFSLACLLLTGRYPGEAKAGRKVLAKTIEQRHASAARLPVAVDAEDSDY